MPEEERLHKRCRQHRGDKVEITNFPLQLEERLRVIEMGLPALLTQGGCCSITCNMEEGEE